KVRLLVERFEFFLADASVKLHARLEAEPDRLGAQSVPLAPNADQVQLPAGGRAIQGMVAVQLRQRIEDPVDALVRFEPANTQEANGLVRLQQAGLKPPGRGSL